MFAIAAMAGVLVSMVAAGAALADEGARWEPVPKMSPQRTDIIQNGVIGSSSIALPPRSIFTLIEARIAKQTSFAQLTRNGIVRWSARAVALIELVAVPSPSFPDTDVFAMRYSVSVLSDDRSVAVDEVICQVLLIRTDGEFADPTVVCAPLNINAGQAS